MKRKTSSQEARVSPPPLRRKVQSTTTNAALTTFFTPASQKPPEKMSWQVVDTTLLVGRYANDGPGEGQEPAAVPRKVAAFDLDCTLIRTVSGKHFAHDERDWQWWHPTVAGQVRDLHQKGYAVVIMTNQGGIKLQPGSKSAKADLRRSNIFKEKVAAVIGQLDIPTTVYAATEPDKYRKPRTGMWTQMEIDYKLQSGALDRSGSFFVGDAGGRLGNQGSKNDHACSDRNLAANLDVPFHTPEEFFLKEAPRKHELEFDPRDYLVDTAPTTFTKKNRLDIVLFCGSPGAGKSHFYRAHLQQLGYERVNQDTLKTRDRCIQVASEHLSKGKSVAVDNTNAEPEVRAKWVALARKSGVPIRCVHFTAPPYLCLHNSTVRALNDGVLNPENRAMLPSVAFRSFSSRFRAPKLAEGFEDVVTVDFVFEGDERQRTIWSRHWI